MWVSDYNLNYLNQHALNVLSTNDQSKSRTEVTIGVIGHKLMLISVIMTRIS